MNDYVIHHGDCVDVLGQYEGQADLILTSPPYDNLRDYGGHEFNFSRVADACVAALKEGGVLVWVVADATVDGSETGTSFRQALGFMERGLKLHDTMIYERQGVNHTDVRYEQMFEYMFVFSAGCPQTVNLLQDKPNTTYGMLGTGGGRGRKKDGIRTLGTHRYVTPEYGIRGNIWRYRTGNIEVGYTPGVSKHPATFPYALAADHIRTWTNEGDLVIDPMAGSGTTLRAAVNLGRRAVGIEIHEPYVDLIRHRMAQGLLV